MRRVFLVWIIERLGCFVKTPNEHLGVEENQTEVRKGAFHLALRCSCLWVSSFLVPYVVFCYLVLGLGLLARRLIVLFSLSGRASSSVSCFVVVLPGLVLPFCLHCLVVLSGLVVYCCVVLVLLSCVRVLSLGLAWYFLCNPIWCILRRGCFSKGTLGIVFLWDMVYPLSVCCGREISLGILVVGCGGEGCRHDSDCFIGPFPLERFVAD
jgi:hypothetical protein